MVPSNKVPVGHTAYSWCTDSDEKTLKDVENGESKHYAAAVKLLEQISANGGTNEDNEISVYGLKLGESQFGLPEIVLIDGGSETKQIPMIYLFFVIIIHNSATNKVTDVIMFDSGFDSQILADTFKITDFLPTDALLQKLSLTAEDVTKIVLSHVHWDHAGSLQMFPNAEIIIRKAELEWMNKVFSDHHASKTRKKNKWYEQVGLSDPGPEHIFKFGITPQDFLQIKELENQRRLTVIEGEGLFKVTDQVFVLGGGGHTPGSQILLVQAKSSFICLCSDSAYLYDNIQNRSALSRSSCCPASNKEMIGLLHELHSMQNVVLVPGHDFQVTSRHPVCCSSDRVLLIYEESYRTADEQFESPIKIEGVVPVRDIPVLEDPNVIEENLKQNKPFVIRGLNENSDLIGKLKNSESLTSFDWTLEYLKSKCSDNEVIVRIEANKMTYKTGKRVPIHKMPFASYVDRLLRGGNDAKGYYLAACNIKKALREVNEDLAIPDFVRTIHKGPFLWVAPQDHYEFCHFDPDDGLLIVLSGKKRVKIISPAFVEEMYHNPIGSYGRTVQAQVLLKENADGSISFNKSDFPHFSGVEIFSTVLEKGDALYIPAFWWHQVVSEKMTLSLNMFWGHRSFLNKLENNSVVSKGFHLWMLNVFEQNRYCSNFVRILSNLHDQIKGFLYNQWTESISDEFCNKICERLLLHLAQTRNENDLFFHLGADFRNKLPPKDKKHTQRLRIRGLMHRSGTGAVKINKRNKH